MGYGTTRRGDVADAPDGGSALGGARGAAEPPAAAVPGRRPTESELRAFLDGARAFHRAHGVVDVLGVVGAQRLIRVQSGRSRSEIAILAVHVDELSAVDRRA